MDVQLLSQAKRPVTRADVVQMQSGAQRVIDEQSGGSVASTVGHAARTDVASDVGVAVDFILEEIMQQDIPTPSGRRLL